MKILIIFTILTIINVIGSTIKSIVTVKGNKYTATIASALYYGFYNIVLIYTVADFPMWQKVAVTIICNTIGVFIVKLVEEKARKDRLWQIDFTINNLKHDTESIKEMLNKSDIPFQYFNLGKHTKFSCYASTQTDSKNIQAIINAFGGKYFITESKSF